MELNTICGILTAEDLKSEKISETAKIIEYNPNKIYLVSTESTIKIYKAIDKLNKNMTKKSMLTRILMAYNLQFNLPTIRELLPPIEAGAS